MLPTSSSGGGQQAVVTSGSGSCGRIPRMASCITVPDSDSEGHYSPARALPSFTSSVLAAKAIKPEPQRDAAPPLLLPTATSVRAYPLTCSSSALCQKKRLLCQQGGGDVVVTPKREVDEECIPLRPPNGFLEGERLVKCGATLVPPPPRPHHHLSPLQHVGQPLHLAPSSQPAELYREYCRPTVYVAAASSLAQPAYLPQQAPQKYVLAGGFLAPPLAPPPAHHHSRGPAPATATLAAVPYTAHPLPAHLQPAGPQGATAAPPTFPAAPAAAVASYSYGLNPLSPGKPQYQHVYQMFGE
ncbi:hypothetical protein V5799_024067 [Amblyomma americanum]|uniref:Uncharacterized protein n=1 Tax=Amblyomma americanum TaxID=6943 RepID=A0AAQ4EDN6_AMBAM